MLQSSLVGFSSNWFGVVDWTKFYSSFLVHTKIPVVNFFRSFINVQQVVLGFLV